MAIIQQNNLIYLYQDKTDSDLHVIYVDLREEKVVNKLLHANLLNIKSTSPKLWRNKWEISSKKIK